MIELCEITKCYNDVLFENLNFKIESTGLYSFIGDNGVGKSTLLKLIAKLIKPNKGMVHNDYITKYMSQNISLIDYLTIKEHFELLQIEVHHLKKFKLYNKLSKYPKELSLGERQRIILCLTLYSNSSVVLLDEPTSHLDKEMEYLMFQNIKKVSENKVVILVSHNIDLVTKFSNYIYKIENKKLFSLKQNKDNKNISKCQTNRYNYMKYVVKSFFYYKKINLLFFLLFFVCSFLFVISINYKNIKSQFIQDQINSSLEYNKFYLNECNNLKKDNITIKDCSNPSNESLKELKKIYKIRYNFDYLLNYLYDCNKFSVISRKNVSLKEGNYPKKYNEIIASKYYKIGDIITLNSNKVLSGNKVDIYSDTLNLVVVGICKEIFSFEDRYYLDYDLILNYLEDKQLINNNVNLYQYYELLMIDNYKYIVYLDNLDFSVLEQKSIETISSGYETIENVKEIFDLVGKIVIYLFFSGLIFLIYYFFRLEIKNINLRKEHFLFLSFQRINILKIFKIEKTIIFSIAFTLVVVIYAAFNKFILAKVCLDLLKTVMLYFCIILFIYCFIKIYCERKLKYD